MPQVLECPKAVQRSLFYDGWRNLLLFGTGGAVKAGEEEKDLLNESLYDNNVCKKKKWLCPGLLKMCKLGHIGEFVRVKPSIPHFH